MKRRQRKYRNSKGLLFIGLIFMGLFVFAFSVSFNAHAQQDIRVIFLHHSCGSNLIHQGDVREGLTALGYEFYDHGYNGEGLCLANGSNSGTNFNVPGDNTDPDGFATIFSQHLNDPPDNTFSYLMQYDVIMFKSCYPASNISNDAQLDDYKSYYLSIRDRMDQYPEKLFIVVTQPPLVPNDTDSASADRARRFVNWLKSDEYLSGHPNVYVFDFFGELADSNNVLKSEYRMDEYDSHPNDRANRAIGPIFVSFIDSAIRDYDALVPGSTPIEVGEDSPPPTIEEETYDAPTTVTGPPASGMLFDFESLVGNWETYIEGSGTTINYGLDSGSAHSGGNSLSIRFTIAPGGWGDCSCYFDPPQNWSSGSGISFWAYSDRAGKDVTFFVASGDPNEPTPFDYFFETGSGWIHYNVPWSALTKAEWMGDSGLKTFDPERIIGYGFGMEGEGTGGEMVLWVDDFSLTD